MSTVSEYVRDRLFSMQDIGYKAFHSRLMPTVDSGLVIGVRTPELRKFAKEFSKTESAEIFLDSLPHRYYEENNLHAFLLCEIRDYGELVRRLNEFLPYVDNWATCDMLRPGLVAKHTEALLQEIERWMQSDKPYTIRFGIEMLMLHFLEEGFKPEFPEKVSRIKSDEYYVKMMIAWYFATALAYRYDEVLPYIENRRLDAWTHNKAIQKAVESYRITDGQKEYLKTLKVKKPAHD